MVYVFSLGTQNWAWHTELEARAWLTELEENHISWGIQ